jgi:Rod binding domain-containing protein
MDEISFSNLPKSTVQASSEKNDKSTNQASTEFSQKRLKKAVKDFESLFIFEMLKEMRQTTHGDFLGKGLGNDIYHSLFDMEIAKLMADKGMGLGDMLLKQLEKRGEIVTSPAQTVSGNQDPKLKMESKDLPGTKKPKTILDFEKKI